MIRWMRAQAVVLLFCAASTAVWAGFDEGLVAYRKGDFATALREWTPLALQGDAAAQFNLGVMYDKGRGIQQDLKEAARWFLLAATQGHTDAQANMGVFYANGRGVQQDLKEAARWNRLAAEQGDAIAQDRLGWQYLKGEGVPQDFKEAVKWYRMAAVKGNARAQSNLGVMYVKGQGVALSQVVGYALYNLSAANDPSSGNIAISNRSALANQMSNADIEAAQDLTREMQKPTNFLAAIDRYERQAAKGVTPVREPSAVRPEQPATATANEVPSRSAKNAKNARDPDALFSALKEGRCSPALGLLKDAATGGNPHAQYLYAVALEKRYCNAQTESSEIAVWIRKAAEAGRTDAQENLANRYFGGYGVPEDKVQAAFWTEKAAQAGSLRAISSLGDKYLSGFGVSKDPELALKLYEKAARAGLAEGARMVGIVLQGEYGVQRNAVASYAWTVIAAARDDTESRHFVEEWAATYAQKMTKAEVEEGKRLAREWKVGRPLGGSRLASTPEQPATATADEFPARPAKRPGVVSCNTRCVNATCWRTYDDGRKVRFQAKQIWDSFSNQFKFDSGGC